MSHSGDSTPAGAVLRPMLLKPACRLIVAPCGPTARTIQVLRRHCPDCPEPAAFRRYARHPVEQSTSSARTATLHRALQRRPRPGLNRVSVAQLARPGLGPTLVSAAAEMNAPAMASCSATSSPSSSWRSRNATPSIKLDQSAETHVGKAADSSHDRLSGQVLSGNEWCSWVTTQRSPSRRSPTVSRSRLLGSRCSSCGVPQRSRAYAKATSSPAVTASETISNDAPWRCQVKNGGQVSR